MSVRRQRALGALIASLMVLAMSLLPRELAWGYVEVPYSFGRVVQESQQITLLRVEKVDKEKNLIIYRKVEDLRGTCPEVMKHNIGRGGLHPREWQHIMAWAEPGQMALFFNNNGASETCINNYWYQAYAGGEWWNMSHGEPFLLRSFAGTPEKCAPLVKAMLAGQEVVVPCMVDGDKNALHNRNGRIQRLKCSLKIQDYNSKRDFVGWGGEDFRQIAGLPGFEKYCALARTDPDALGVAPQDFDGDGKLDLCVYGSHKVVLLHNAGNSLNEMILPGVSGARAVAWADYNQDGKPDLLVATPLGPMLYTNEGEGKFFNSSAGLPQQAYHNVTAAAWIDYDGDGYQDLLVSNGFLGLRLYRNRGKEVEKVVDKNPRLGPWHVNGPYDFAGGQGFNISYPPEKGLVDLSQEGQGKKNVKTVWRKIDLPDKQVNSFMPLFPPEQHSQSIAYLYREIETEGAIDLPVSLGSDDTLTVFLNGEKILAENVSRGAAPDQNQVTLKLKPGKNQLLMKIGNGDGEWGWYFAAGEFQKPVPRLFEDVTDKVGLGPEGLFGTARGSHLGVADLNGDGRADFLLHAGKGLVAFNTPEGFVEAKTTGIDYVAGKVAPVLADFNGDKAIDLFVPQNGVNRLFQNNGKGQFVDVAAKAGALGQSLGYATCASVIDLKKRGVPDLLVGCLNGPNRFLRNKGDGTFVDATEELGLEVRIFNSRAVSACDLNNDGVMDVVFNNEGQESAVLLGKARDQVALRPGE